MSDDDSSSHGGQANDVSLYRRLGGEDAISAVVDDFVDVLQKDERVARFFSATNVNALAHHQKQFLTFAFGGTDDTEYEGKSLRDAHSGLGISEEDFNAVVEDLTNVLDGMDVSQELIAEVIQVVEGVKGEILGDGKKSGKNVTVIYDLEPENCELLKKHLEWVVEAVGSIEEVGQTIYDALFNGAGEGKKLFVSPKKATAFRFISQVQRYVQGSGDVNYLEDELYNMAMRHIAYISPAQSVEYMPLFIGTITNVIKGILDEEWNDFGAESWSKLLNYVGGMLIRNLGEFTGKVHLIRKSWGVITSIDSTVSRKDTKDEKDEKEEDGDEDATKKKTGSSINFGESLYFNLGVMSPEIAGMFKRSKDQLAPLFGEGFGSLTVLISDPQLLNEELYILGIRHLKYGTTPEYFPVFGQAVMVTLRSMLPRDWNWAHEDAWGWLWETCATYLSKTIEQGHVNKHLIDETMEKNANANISDLGAICHKKLFSLSDDVQNYFYKPNTMVAYILEKVLYILSNLSHEPVAIAHEIRALGMRHIKYNIPPIHFPLFGKSLIYTFSSTMEGFWTDEIEHAWLSVFDFVCRCMTRSVNEGSNLVTKAMVNNSVDEMDEVLKQAPRGIRDSWLLEVNVSGEILSPFYWAVYDGKTQMAVFILKDLLAIRADRETYYCGAQSLFKTHPGIIKNLALLCPNLLPILFDGLMWRSRVTDNGFKRVNYFIRDTYGDPTSDRYLDPYHSPLAELGRLHYAELFVHPVTQFIVDLKWTKFARGMFIQGQFYFFVVLVLFMIGYVGFEFEGAEKGSTKYNGAFYTRIVTAVINLIILLFRQIPRLIQEVMRNQVSTLNIGKMKVAVPVSLSNPLNVARLLINMLLVVSFLMQPEFVGDGMANDTVRSWCTSIAVLLLWWLPFDWFCLDITLASFKLRFTNILGHLFTSLLFSACLIVGFALSLSLSNADHSSDRVFDKAGTSIISLFAAFTGNFVFESSQLTGQMQFFFIVFCVFSVLFLLNLMTAVFTATTFLENKDIEGMTYLNRAKIIVELESVCTMEQRVDLWAANRFDERIEFDEGDLGLNGGIQVSEPLSKHAKDDMVDDHIQRFPGEASPKIPWPVSQSAAKTTDEKLAYLEGMYVRILKTIREMMKKKGPGAGGTSMDRSELSTKGDEEDDGMPGSENDE